MSVIHRVVLGGAAAYIAVWAAMAVAHGICSGWRPSTGETVVTVVVAVVFGVALLLPTTTVEAQASAREALAWCCRVGWILTASIIIVGLGIDQLASVIDAPRNGIAVAAGVLGMVGCPMLVLYRLMRPALQRRRQPSSSLTAL